MNVRLYSSGKHLHILIAVLSKENFKQGKIPIPVIKRRCYVKNELIFVSYYGEKHISNFLIQVFYN